VIFVKSIEDAIAEATKQTAKWGQEVFVIGGGEIYKQSLPFCHKIYLTRIHQNFSGDTYFPEIDEQVFTLTDRKDRTEPIPFSFLTYVRK
jgi:dihydrofolate reductase